MKKNGLISIGCLWLGLGIITNCKPPNNATKHPADNTIAGNFSDQHTLKFDSVQITTFVRQFPKLLPFKAEIDTFYRRRQYAFAWFDNKGLIEQATHLYNLTQDIGKEGIIGNFEYAREFAQLIENEPTNQTNRPIVDTELMLTAQYFVYAKKVWTGLDETQTRAMNWYLPRKKLSYSQLLDSLLRNQNQLEQAPVYRQYGLLKTYLQQYKDIEKKGGFPIIEADRNTYKIGDSSLVLGTVRHWLFMAGDLPADNQSLVFDPELEKGVRQFQRRFGQPEEARIGAALVKAMNVPLQARIEQIVVNMERSRWVPVGLADPYLVVNLPEYKLHLYENNNLLWSMNVVVGQQTHKTVIFKGDIKYIVFSPYWNIPPGILRDEIRPGMARNPNYLAKHNMEWYEGSIRQKPGANNALGLVKFLLPNSYNIYLHDTPSKSLFKETKRDFSHGCIRLAEPQKLAAYLLRNDAAWTDEKIEMAMHANREQFVKLQEPCPLFIAYFTAWIDRQGQLNFRKDLYQRDHRLATMLFDKPVL